MVVNSLPHNPGNQHLILFPQCFLTQSVGQIIIELLLKCRLQMFSNFVVW